MGENSESRIQNSENREDQKLVTAEYAEGRRGRSGEMKLQERENDLKTRECGVEPMKERLDLATERLGEKAKSSFRAEPNVRTRNPVDYVIASHAGGVTKQSRVLDPFTRSKVLN